MYTDIIGTMELTGSYDKKKCFICITGQSKPGFLYLSLRDGWLEGHLDNMSNQGADATVSKKEVAPVTYLRFDMDNIIKHTW